MRHGRDDQFERSEPLANEADWDRLEGARRAISGKLSNGLPAPRYTNPNIAKMIAHLMEIGT